jgi:hypothetical protein
MKWFVASYLPKTVIVSVALLGLSCAAHAAPPSTPSAKLKSGAYTNPSTNVVAIPQSVFVWPPTVKDGRDPFFPESIRPYNEGKAPTNHTVATAITLKLNGVSGTGTNRLVMINGYTFAQNESHEIPTSSGRIKVRCIEITGDESVLVEVNGVPRELRMKEH